QLVDLARHLDPREDDPGRLRAARRLLTLRMPEGFRRPDSVGDWIGFVVGLVIMAAIAAAILGMAGLFAFTVASGRMSLGDALCSPGDPCRFTTYRVRNDTGRPVLVSECAHHCGPGDEILRSNGTSIAAGGAGGTVSTHVYDREWWEVSTKAGRQLGCLVL